MHETGECNWSEELCKGPGLAGFSHCDIKELLVEGGMLEKKGLFEGEVRSSGVFLSAPVVAWKFSGDGEFEWEGVTKDLIFFRLWYGCLLRDDVAYLEF